MKRKKILVFGSLIREQGGQLTTGLSTVIWHISKHLSDNKNLKVFLFATDFYKSQKQVGKLEILGWNLKVTIFDILKHPYQTIKFLSISFYMLIFFRLKFFRSFIYLLIFDRAIKNTKPDIIHIHGTNYIYFHYILKGKRIPIIITVHGINGQDPNIKNFKFQRKIEKIISNCSFEQFVFVSTNLRDEWSKIYGLPKSKTNVIVNAFDSNIFCFEGSTIQRTQNKVRISTVARIYPLKGQERVIEAMSKLPNKEYFEYHIIGNGDNEYVNMLKKRVENNDLNVYFHGERDSTTVASFLRSTDYMILPSSSEGFGLAIIESIACGTKVIVPSSLPICKEPGILNLQNSIFIHDSSADSIKEVLYHLDVTKDISYSKIEVSNSVKNLNWNNIADKYYNIIYNFYH